jgi:hypothetical protein
MTKLSSFRAIILMMVLHLNFNSVFGIVEIKNSPENNNAEIHFSIDSLNHWYQSLSLENDNLENSLFTATETHTPQEPFKSFFLIGNPSDFKVEIEEGQKIEMNDFQFNLVPKKPCRCHHSFHHDLKGEVSSDRKLKSQTNFSPRRIQLDYLGDFRGTPITRLLFFPQSIDPLKKMVNLYPRAQLKISSLNNRKIHLEKSLEPILIPLLKMPAKKILIVTPPQWISTLQNFKKWKEKKGFSISFMNFEQTADPAFDLAQLKNQLKSRYLNPNTTFHYVILVGHQDIIPTNFVPTENDFETPSDLLTFTFGEGPDFIPDAFFGRFPVNTVEELQQIIAKTIHYETKNPTLKHQYRKGIGIASNEGVDPSDEDYLLRIQKPLQEKKQISFRNFLQKNPDSNPENINEEIRRGASLIHYLGHGSGYSWESLYGGPYNSDDIKLSGAENDSTEILSPTTQTPLNPIIIDVSCQNGRPLYDSHFGERFLNEKNQFGPIGASAFFGGSVDISWDPPALMSTRISVGLTHYQIKNLGPALLYGQLALWNFLSAPSSIIDNLKWYHLLGDPSLSF